MRRFKVGDQVVANAIASGYYSITVEGYRGRVVALQPDGYMEITCSKGGPPYYVEEDHFNLMNPKLKRNLPAWF